MTIADCHITVIHTGLAHDADMRQFLLECLNIREQVFCEEQHIEFGIEQDGKDNESGHILLWYQNIPVGTMRYRQTDEGIRLERLSVLSPYRGLQYGKLLIQAGIRAARDEHLEGQIYLHAQVSALPFYHKLGFIDFGDEFSEGGIAHRNMFLPKETENELVSAADKACFSEQAG